MRKESSLVQPLRTAASSTKLFFPTTPEIISCSTQRVTEQRASRSRRTAACRCRRAREEVATHRPTSLVNASVRRLPSDVWECRPSAPTEGFQREPHGTDRVLNPKNELLWWTYSYVVRPREAICGVRSVLPKTRGGSRHVGASGPSSSNGSGIHVGQHADSSKGAQRAAIVARRSWRQHPFATVIRPGAPPLTAQRNLRLSASDRLGGRRKSRWSSMSAIQALERTITRVRRVRCCISAPGIAALARRSSNLRSLGLLCFDDSLRLGHLLHRLDGSTCRLISLGRRRQVG